MPRVLCTLPNASSEISGFVFFEHELGMLSEEISEEAAAEFASINGYKLMSAASNVVAGVVADIEHGRDHFVERAKRIGFRVKLNWGLARLRAEVEAAEKRDPVQVPVSVSVSTQDSEPSALTTNCVESLTTEQIQALTTDQVYALTTEQIGALTTDQVSAVATDDTVAQ